MKIEEVLFEKSKERIKKAIKNASETTYYNRIFSDNNINLNIETYSDFTKIPITTKNQLRYNYKEFVKDGKLPVKINQLLTLNSSSYFDKNQILNDFDLELYVTSGSTGIPMEVIRGKYEIMNNFFNLNRIRKYYGDISSLEKYVWVLPESIFMRKYVFNECGEYFKDSDHGYIYCIDNISDKSIAKFISFCKKENIESLIAWPTFLECLSLYIERQSDFGFISLIKHIESNSEILLPSQEQKIRSLFNKDVLNVYSGVETNFIAVAKDNGYFHLLHNNVFVEFLENEGCSKKIVVTNLNSNETSLLRYELGDLGEWVNIVEDPNEKYPFIFKIYEARSNSQLKSKSGTNYEFNLVADIVHIAQNELDFQFDKYMMIQKSYFEFEFRYISEINQDGEVFKSFLESRISNVLGYNINIKMNHIKDEYDEFRLGRKFRFFECEIRD